MAWFGLAKIALQAGGKIYANRQRTKMAMSDAQLMHAERMARGEETYQGKLLESRDNDYKDEIVLAILTLPIVVLAWSVWTEDPAAMQKIDVFFEYFSNPAKMVYKFMDFSRSKCFWNKRNADIPKWRL